MEFTQLDEALSILESAISEFPVEAVTLDDFKPIEDKIISLRESLRALGARRLTMSALIDSEMTEDLSEDVLNRSMSHLNENTTNYLINTKTLKLCYQSQAIQDIIYKNAGSAEIQERTKACLSQLFAVNDRLITKAEKKKQLMKRQYQLRLDCHHEIHNYQDYLREREVRRNEQLEEMNPNIFQFKDKINKYISKINIMKRLMTNIIAANCQNLHKNEDLIGMLAEHKELINFEKIVELAHGHNSVNSDS